VNDSSYTASNKIYWSTKRVSKTLTHSTPWLTSKDTLRTSMSTPSSVHTLPVYKKHQHRLYRSYKIQINLPGYISLIFHIYNFKFYITSLQNIQGVYAATKQQIHVLWAFYRLYFITQQRSRDHFNLLLLLSCNFKNFVTLAKPTVKTVWRCCSCMETCSSACDI